MARREQSQFAYVSLRSLGAISPNGAIWLREVLHCFSGTKPTPARFVVMPDDHTNLRTVFRWRRLDVAGLEILSVTNSADGIYIRGQCIDAGDEPFCVHHEWSLDSSWRSKILRLTMVSEGGDRQLGIERAGDAQWKVDGQDRPDLEGCDEIDLSFTPICNCIALRRVELAINDGFELTALHVSLPQLFIAPSRQKYLRTGESAYRYIDLGLSAGFEAALQVDAQRMIRNYEGLFEAV
jgi:hypothetical protein